VAERLLLYRRRSKFFRLALTTAKGRVYVYANLNGEAIAEGKVGFTAG
jgi:hypothetical protein